MKLAQAHNKQTGIEAALSSVIPVALERVLISWSFSSIVNLLPKIPKPGPFELLRHLERLFNYSSCFNCANSVTDERVLEEFGELLAPHRPGLVSLNEIFRRSLSGHSRAHRDGAREAGTVISSACNMPPGDGF